MIGNDSIADGYRLQAGQLATQLAAIAGWQVDQATLRRLERVLNSIDVAAAGRDAAGLAAGRADLVQLADAIRLTPIGETSPTAPEDLPLERINEIIHSLHSELAEAPTPASERADHASAE